MPLRIRRGTNAERLTITPIEGELIYTTDTKRVFIGDGNTVGGISLITTTGGILGNDLVLNGNSITGVGNLNFAGLFNNGSVTINGENIYPSVTTLNNGYATGTIQIGGSPNDSVAPHCQLIRNWENNKVPFEKNYGISNALDSLTIEYNAYRGTIESKTILQSGDWIFSSKFFGYDGNSSIISSLVSHSVDNNASILPGIVPGKITMLTSSSTGGFNNLSFDSRGRLGINNSNPREALDVSGGALFEGTVTAPGFIGSLYADDSSLIINGTNGDITNSNINTSSINSTLYTTDNLRISGRNISPRNPISQNGHLFGILQLGGSLTNNIEPHCQLLRNWEDILTPMEKIFGLSNGFSSVYEDRYSSRGTIASPTSLQPGDFIFNTRFLGHDGNDYSTVCAMSCSVDPGGTIEPGLIPGRISFTTTSDTSGFFNILSFDSRGYLGVNSFNVREALDVTGNGIFTGTVFASAFSGSLISNDSLVVFDDATGNINGNAITTGSLNVTNNATITGNLIVDGNLTASAFKGSLVADDSTIIVDGLNSNINGNIINSNTLNAGNLTISDSRISPKNPISQNGYLIGTLQIGGSFGNNLEPHCQIIKYWEDNLTPVEKTFGISNGFSSMYEDHYSSRGTTASPTIVQPGDFIFNNRFLAFDGNDYSTVCAMSFSVDSPGTVDPGLIPGKITFTTTSDTSGFFNILSFDSRGYLGVNSFNVREALDVTGNGIFTGTVFASAFSGSLISNDSLVVFDDATGAVQGGTVTSQGYIQFGSYDATGRAGLPAANGMVIYNTTANRFQGYQNGAWINLDDGSAAP